MYFKKYDIYIVNELDYFVMQYDYLLSMILHVLRNDVKYRMIMKTKD
jgi:hypothetical protein